MHVKQNIFQGKIFPLSLNLMQMTKYVGVERIACTCIQIDNLNCGNCINTKSISNNIYAIKMGSYAVGFLSKSSNFLIFCAISKQFREEMIWGCPIWLKAYGFVIMFKNNRVTFLRLMFISYVYLMFDSLKIFDTNFKLLNCA